MFPHLVDFRNRDLEIAKYRARLGEAEEEVSCDVPKHSTWFSSYEISKLHKELEGSREKIAEVEGDIRRLLSLRSKGSHKHSMKTALPGGARSLASTIATMRSTLPMNVQNNFPVILEPSGMQ